MDPSAPTQPRPFLPYEGGTTHPRTATPTGPHPAHPDALIAQALGVCWHSPTSDRWPCTDA